MARDEVFEGVDLTKRYGKGRRASTLRKHVKTWERLRKWMKVTFHKAWPTQPEEFAMYLEARANEPCGRSVPGSIYKTLLFMEAAGEFPVEEQLGRSSAVKNVLEEINMSLAEFEPRFAKKAWHLPVRIVETLEELVLDYRLEAYPRAMNEGTPMVKALEDAMKDTTVKERYFLTPAALGAASSHSSPPGIRMKSRSPRRDGSGDARGSSWGFRPKGKGKGKKGKSKKAGGRTIHSHTPDGRAICYSWNNKDQRLADPEMLPSPGVKNDRGSRAEGTTKGLPTDKLGDAEERAGKSRDEGLVDRNRKHGAVESKAPSRFTYRVLYLFAGGERKTSVVEQLRKILLTKGWDLEAVEVDLKRGDQWDLSDESLQDSIIKDLEAGKYHGVICTPPCSTWSRVRCANLRGPPPLRTKEHLWGFPWVGRKWGKELHLGNILVKFSIRVWSTVCRCPVSFDGYVIFLFGEHPEDLGAVIREEDRVKLVPASIWQLSEIINLVNDPNNAIRTENSVDIKRQVMEEVEAGTIIEMSALGAVPKELGSSVVRIVHDGSFSVDVNHRIKVLDRMRFPSIDDAAGILAHVEDEIRSKGGGARCSLLYDISRAHKPLPVDEDDWGYQAFRLPGENQEDKVYLHTRGTFGIASAAYHWQRLAANVALLLLRVLRLYLSIFDSVDGRSCRRRRSCWCSSSGCRWCWRLGSWNDADVQPRSTAGNGENEGPERPPVPLKLFQSKRRSPRYTSSLRHFQQPPVPAIPAAPAAPAPPPPQRVDPYAGASAPQQAPRTFMVQCPKGATPGTLVEVTTPEGFSVQVSVPMNVAPGDQFSVQY
eukprot:s164_g49.t1